MKYNERSWAGHLIGWINLAVSEGRTIFQGATNDAGIKMASGKTKFPDVLLFTDKTSGIVFNGWELKFPDTAVDDREMLLNALEKAQRIHAESFVTWNGTEAVIWKIGDDRYVLDSLSEIKRYPPAAGIRTRDDLADYTRYEQNAGKLRQRAEEILHDLGQLLASGALKPAIDITGNFIEAVKSAAAIIQPQFRQEIERKKGSNKPFRDDFNSWKVYESSTLKILASSSRRAEVVHEEDVLAKFTFYNLIGKVLFYLTLSTNLDGLLAPIAIDQPRDIKSRLEEYFEVAKRIDYQAVFRPYFTDILDFTPVMDQAFYTLLQRFNEFDFKFLPPDVIGNILENLVPKEEKQKFGQYFTSEILANLVAFPAVSTAHSLLFDPTSGAGTFLSSFYQILKYHGQTSHGQLLNQIWGNDISHFPAILSVINLYKQEVTNHQNFPRVTRDDFFNLQPGQEILFPDPQQPGVQVSQPIPLFDGIASNFPFIQQEDIPNDILTDYFRGRFQSQQQAFLQDQTFKINERADYFTYCVYNSLHFLKVDGYLAAITSNAWLGKEYGVQFKKFLLDNFHIRYVVRSNAEHWFSDSQVSTVYTVLQKGPRKQPTRFVTLNFKLEEYFNNSDTAVQLKQIEALYTEIDHCQNPKNPNWTADISFPNLSHHTNGLMTVCSVDAARLQASLAETANWSTFFISDDLFGRFEQILKPLYPDVIDAFRGERTGWNPMFIIPAARVKHSGIEAHFLIPYVKSPTELKTLGFTGKYSYYLFSCSLPLKELQSQYPGAYQWIRKFEHVKNLNGTLTIPQACAGHKPFWYSLTPKPANIVTAINPYTRFFFSFSAEKFSIDQRLVAVNVKDQPAGSQKHDVTLIAALLNSVITLLTMEMRGTSRNLGALDLNANYFKKLKILDPALLDAAQVAAIKKAFLPLMQRQVGDIFSEVGKADRIGFDRVVLAAYGLDPGILENLYQTLLNSVTDRITLKEK